MSKDYKNAGRAAFRIDFIRGKHNVDLAINF